MNDGHVAKRTYQEEVGHGLPGQTLAHALILHVLRSRRGLDGVVYRVSVANLCPERIRHIHQVLIGSVHREVHVGRGAPVHIARHHLADFDETTLEVIPGRIVEIVHTPHARSIVGIIILCVVVVFHGLVQEVLTRCRAHRKEHGSSHIFYIFGSHNYFVLMV